jgi:acylphosphatase
MKPSPYSQGVEASDKVREVLAIVHGNVQGVFFRQWVKEKALEHNLTGSAKNLDDGTVEVIAQGKESVVRKFLDHVYAGPEEAEVESVSVQWGPVTEPISDFKIE